MENQRRNNKAEMKITEQLESIKEDVCDKICRWRAYALEINKDPDDAEEYLLENYCEHCPLGRL